MAKRTVSAAGWSSIWARSRPGLDHLSPRSSVTGLRAAGPFGSVLVYALGIRLGFTSKAQPASGGHGRPARPGTGDE